MLFYNVLLFLPNCVRFFYMFYIMFFWLELKEPKLPPFLIVKFKGVGESTDFKASESSAKMFARKPKILTIGSLTVSPNHFVKFRLSAQTTEVFTAPSLHFYASLSGGRTSFAFLLLCSCYNVVWSADGIGKGSVKKFSSKAVKNSSCLSRQREKRWSEL